MLRSKPLEPTPVGPRVARDVDALVAYLGNPWLANGQARGHGYSRAGIFG